MWLEGDSEMAGQQSRETIVRVYTVETRRKCEGSNKNSSSVAVWGMGVHTTRREDRGDIILTRLD